ncbi:MAG TPA: hypothetical protein VK095_09355 [Beutenbergiaceae bacterium]|nr:hypothetical protein [Beutenbergiaceae bacterium]
MSTPVITVRREELSRRREEILTQLGLTLDQFEDLMRTSTLSGVEWEAREELEDISFLLGETLS